MNFFAELDLKLFEEVKSLQGLHIKCLSVINFSQKYAIFTNMIDFFSSTGSMISKAIGFFLKLRGGN